ncbi:MAG: type II toxin-antitoxin system VapC family toxin [Chitinivibrionales bacterium]|nr:type II toxin-antitoxin system VapC family toxin [Chitinivibrionales bacterium]
MKVSLDTNAYTKFVQGHRPLSELLERAEEIFISPIVLGELIAGFTLGSRRRENIMVLKDFLDTEASAECAITKDVAERYAFLFADLRAKGTPIPTNDLWIAAAALETGSRLISYDDHFKKVPGLVVLAP